MAENNCYYRLTLSRIIKDGLKKIGDVIINPSLSLKKLHTLNFNEHHTFALRRKKLKIGDFDTILIMRKVVIHKRIGQHNSIDVNFDVLHTVYEGVLFQLEDIIGHFKDMSAKLEYSEDGENYFDVAENYCVVGVKPHIKNKKEKESYTTYTLELELQMKSWDVFMDMTPYSRAYTGRHLTEILKDMMDAYDYGKGGSRLWKTKVEGMRILNVEIDKAKKTKVELRLPYLVQYNETDYNFLLRNANRCGEFLYFERGALNLGLTRIESGGTEKVTSITDYNAIESMASPDLWVLSEKYSYKSLDGQVAEDDKKENPYVTEFANDDFFELLPKDGYDSEEGWRKVLVPIWSQHVKELLKYENLSVLALKNSVSVAMFETDSQLNSKGNNKKYNKTYFSNTSQEPSSYDEKENLYSPFADFYTQKIGEGDEAETIQSKSGNIPLKSRPDSLLYYDRGEAERKAALKQYKLVFDHCQKDIQLGDVVAVDEIKSKASFVVVDVCSYSNVDNESWSDRMEVTIIPKESDNVAPLPAEVELVRKSGAQSAVVVNSNDPKRLGRVRVRYHWQGEKDDATPWIRIAVPFASDDDSGTFSTLTPGDEVMVDYEYGNIERPYVVGSLYNGTNQPPFGQRKYSQIIRSRNGHMIGFREPTNASSIYKSILPVALDLFSYIPQVSGLTDFAKSQNEHRGELRAMGGIDIRDSYGIYSISLSSDSRKIDISSPFGTVNLDAAMGITISAPNGEVTIKGKNINIEAGNNLTLKSGTNIENSIVSAIGSKANAIEVAKKEGTLLAGAVPFTLCDFKALRYFVELMIKPVSGTLKIHSGRYLMLESGKGKAHIPTSANSWMKSEYDIYIEAINKDISMWISNLSAYKQKHKSDFVNLCGKRSAMESDLQAKTKLQFRGGKTYSDLVNDLIWSDAPDYDNRVISKYLQTNLDTNRAYYEIFKFRLWTFQNEVASFVNGPAKGGLDADQYVIAKKILNLKEDNRYNNFVDNRINYDFLYESREKEKQVLRRGIHIILDRHRMYYKADGIRANDLATYTDNNWTELVKSIAESITKSTSGIFSMYKFGKFISDALNKLNYPIDVGSTYSWDAGTKPCILLSEEKDKTLGVGGEEYESCKPPLVALVEYISI